VTLSSLYIQCRETDTFSDTCFIEERGTALEVWISLPCGQMNSHIVNDQVQPGEQWQNVSTFKLLAQLSDDLCFMHSGLRGTAGQMLGIGD